MKDPGAAQLAQALAHNRSLLILRVCSNEIGEEGVWIGEDGDKT